MRQLLMNNLLLHLQQLLQAERKMKSSTLPWQLPPDPVAVRYAFRNYCPEANVMTTMGQPLVPFRTDDWPLDDIGRIR